MRFDNRPPIDLESTTQLACASRDGGVYNGIGYDAYCVYQGKRLHLVHRYSSGCVYQNHVAASCTHMGLFDSLPSLIDFLRERLDPQADEGAFPWWAALLLDELGYKGEEG
jgi:hypothetical protein